MSSLCLLLNQGLEDFEIAICSFVKYVVHQSVVA